MNNNRFWTESVPYVGTILLGIFLFAAYLEGVLG